MYPRRLSNSLDNLWYVPSMVLKQSCTYVRMNVCVCVCMSQLVQKLSE